MKRYLVAYPSDYSEEQSSVLEDKARNYYGEKDYRQCRTIEDNQEEVADLLQKVLETECLADLCLLGINAIILSQTDSVYFAHDWERSDMCKMMHMLAFKYGLDIHYESV